MCRNFSKHYAHSNITQIGNADSGDCAEVLWYNGHMCIRSVLTISCAVVFAAHASENETRTFQFRGQVINVAHGQHQLLNIRQGTEGRSVWNMSTNGMVCRSGDFVSVRGHVDPNATSRVKSFATEITLEGHGPLPETRLLSFAEFADSGMKAYAATLRGTIVAVRQDDIDSQWNMVDLRFGEGRVLVETPENEHALADLEKLVDAEVECRGLRTTSSGWRSFVGPFLLLYGEDGLSVLKPPPADPFAVPEMTSPAVAHRQRVTGTVLGSGARIVFLTTPIRKFLPVHTRADAPNPPSGARVTVSGFVSRGNNDLQLTEAYMRLEDAPIVQLPPARRVNASDLFSNISGNDMSNADCYGKVIRIRGRVQDIVPGRYDNDLLKIDAEGHPVLVDISATGDGGITVGCEIDVSGICFAEFDNSPSNTFPRFGGFTVYPRAAADVIVTRRPPWWTPTRFLICLGALLSTLAIVLVWNILLRRLSERRAHDLTAEGLRRASAELKVEERTRLAVELHDALSQTLTGVALQIETALDIDERSPAAARTFLKTAQQMLASCRQELRLCLWDLRSRTFQEKDMTEAIRRTVTPHVSKARLAVRFNVPRENLTDSFAHSILKIVRELVVNAIRHGKASDIRIAGERRDGVIRFVVADNGCGFDPDSAPGPGEGHFGILGIRERAAEYNGDISVESTPGRGTRVTVRLREDKEDSEK